METFLLFIGIVLLVIGVILIYDARPIVKKYLGSGNQNNATLFLKVIGTIFSFIGVILVSNFLVF